MSLRSSFERAERRTTVTKQIKESEPPKIEDEGLRVPDYVDQRKGDVTKVLFSGVPTEMPKMSLLHFQEQLYTLDQNLSKLMEDRKKEAGDIKKMIEIQNEEAKITANKEKQMLTSKVKMEADLEKDALRRLKLLKTSITKIEAETKGFERSIEALTKKRRAEEAKNQKALEALSMKENQARLKREQAEANLTSLDLVQKQKILQKALKQKQLLRLEFGEPEPEEEEEVTEEFMEIPPPPLPDIPEETCDDPGIDVCSRENCLENYRPLPSKPRNPMINQMLDGCHPPCEPRIPVMRCADDWQPAAHFSSRIVAEPPNCYPNSNNCDPIYPQSASCNPCPVPASCTPYVGSFNLIKVLARGYFSEVALVRSSLTNNKYIVKSICKKDNISKICRMRTVFTLLCGNKHPFLVNMYDFIQDNGRVYFVMEYLCNGNLKEHLKKFSLLEESEVVFFSACALLAIDHLHSLDIAHRDVKLDNLVLDACGYAKLVDFDLAIPYAMYNTPLYEKYGTSIYKAPEFFKPCEFTTRAADYWALGVVIHALLTSKCINVKPCLQLATEKLSPVAEDLLVRVLHLVPSQRLGCGINGGCSVMKHPFYKDIDWKALYQKRIQPPRRFLTNNLKSYPENGPYKNYNPP